MEESNNETLKLRLGALFIMVSKELGVLRPVSRSGYVRVIHNGNGTILLYVHGSEVAY